MPQQPPGSHFNYVLGIMCKCQIKSDFYTIFPKDNNQHRKTLYKYISVFPCTLNDFLVLMCVGTFMGRSRSKVSGHINETDHVVSHYVSSLSCDDERCDRGC